MKKLIILFVIILSFSACNTNQNRDYLIFSGTIKDPVKKNIELKKIDGTLIKTIKINKTGTFLDTLKIESGYYFFSIDKKTIDIYLGNNEDLKVIVDSKSVLNTISFEGKFVNENEYLHKKSEVIKEQYVETNDLYSLKENDFVGLIVTSREFLLVKNRPI